MQVYSSGFFQHIAYAAPDIFVGASIVVLIFIKLIFGEEYSKKIFPKLSIAISFCGFLLMLVYSTMEGGLAKKLVTYEYVKVILLFFTFISVSIIDLSRMYKKYSSVLYVMIFGIVTAILVCLSANNFLVLLLGLEGYTISLCFLLMLDGESSEGRRNALRFLLSSAVMTAVFFYGISLYYSSFGSFLFADIKPNESLPVVIGTLMILSALLFKLAAAPFHSWAVDMYQKAPIVLVLFFDTVLKLFMMFVFVKMCAIMLNKGVFHCGMFLTIVAIMSMIIGGIMPLRQKNIKRFIAYVSVGHIGFAMTVFATTKDVEYFRFAITYMVSCIIPSICFFVSIMSLQKHRKVLTFKDLLGLVYESPIIAYSIILSMFAMVGLPPFINFIAKVEILKMLVVQKNWLLLSVGCVYSLICVVYAVKCSRYIFTKKPKEFEINNGVRRGNLAVILALSALILGSVGYSSIDRLFYKIV